MAEGGLPEEAAAFVRVMTDEQMEILRRQISAYATICEQLVEMHRALTAQQNSLEGMRMTAVYPDPLMASGGAKISSRQRWTPTPMQLQILEGMFYQGNGTPSRHKIKEITSELSQHGQISETNVYNWFQNRRARSKRKQMVAAQNNAESEAEAESQNEKKDRQDQMTPAVDEHSLQDVSSELRFINQHSNGYRVVYTGEIPGFGDSLSNPMFESLMAKVGTQVAFGTFQSGEDAADSRRVLREQEF